METAQGPTLAPQDNRSLTGLDVQRLREQGRSILVVRDDIFDVTDFLDAHPGGRGALAGACRAEDGSAAFFTFHDEELLAGAARDWWIGKLSCSSSDAGGDIGAADT